MEYAITFLLGAGVAFASVRYARKQDADSVIRRIVVAIIGA